MRFFILTFLGLCMATRTMGQSCANGEGFCDSAGSCQDGTGASFGLLPECAGNRRNDVRGRRNRVRIRQNGGETCNRLGGFCDSSGNCQDGTGASFGAVDCGAQGDAEEEQKNNNAGNNGGETCNGLGGFCDSSGNCQDGTGASFGPVDCASR
ncbi:hypothetical protein BFJ66_g17048 [Fusarium oxysporum f. sp. cepae]|uniref:Uncharacterized protein n=2 Tax=Fusarium TaxID=5506 RepID=A0A3L6MTX9_FUSOX|nr:hypothetical protein FPRO03_12177 [Fusarium proliferatum]RKK07554.1 hypothetical protein BFJ65_g17759 [Fusarium oxysporum f. sp. cepae]RKK21460.1 hypothetical protein BFJ67_g17262 [Fusarium oxysporum f. sp. cepae]RKK26594.1 hypothetical protein BFJ66_g17048 [Fusarium oxysporum f. sp. cepae]RKL22146.1 hypothetical protein BFJ72_g14736 [Fusarium proliferatum]